MFEQAAIKLSAAVRTEMSKREEDGLGRKMERPEAGSLRRVRRVKNISSKCAPRKIRTPSEFILMDFPCQP